MLLGFLTSGQLGSLEETLRWAARHGFKAVSIAVSPGSRFLDLDAVIANPRSVLELEEESGVLVSAIGFYGNPISPDPQTRRLHTEFFLKVIRALHKMDKSVATGWVGRFPGSIEDNVREIGSVWPSILREAEDGGIRVAIENCPGNIMYRPDVWRAVFEKLGSEAIGLEFDPSHLVCQFIEPLDAMDEFGDRIYHVHAKDAEVDWDRVSRLGITAEGWCPHRLPGFGVVDWARFFTVLRKHGYDYAVNVEHEDPFFSYEEGLIVARKFLELYIP